MCVPRLILGFNLEIWSKQNPLHITHTCKKILIVHYSQKKRKCFKAKCTDYLNLLIVRVPLCFLWDPHPLCATDNTKRFYQSFSNDPVGNISDWKAETFLVVGGIFIWGLSRKIPVGFNHDWHGTGQRRVCHQILFGDRGQCGTNLRGW